MGTVKTLRRKRQTDLIDGRNEEILRRFQGDPPGGVGGVRLKRGGGSKKCWNKDDDNNVFSVT